MANDRCLGPAPRGYKVIAILHIVVIMPHEDFIVHECAADAMQTLPPENEDLHWMINLSHYFVRFFLLHCLGLKFPMDSENCESSKSE